MKRILFNLLLACSLSACLSAFISENRRNLSRLRYGMTKDEVHAVMGRQTVRSFSNPYRTAMNLGKDGNPVEVFSYWTDGSTENGISDNELTPVVFQDGKVVGWGREFWTEFKVELRIKSE